MPRKHFGCKFDGCQNHHYSLGYCQLHYQRSKNNVPLDTHNHQAQPLGWIMGGYRWISTPDRGEILEHRYVMEKHLGRILSTDEVVHHKNENKLDNQLENLELIDRATHTSIHRIHKEPCQVCGKTDHKGAFDLCSKHYARTQRFLKKHSPNLLTISMPREQKIALFVSTAVVLG